MENYTYMGRRNYGAKLAPVDSFKNRFEQTINVNDDVAYPQWGGGLATAKVTKIEEFETKVYDWATKTYNPGKSIIVSVKKNINGAKVRIYHFYRVVKLAKE